LGASVVLHTARQVQDLDNDAVAGRTNPTFVQERRALSTVERFLDRGYKDVQAIRTLSIQINEFLLSFPSVPT